MNGEEPIEFRSSKPGRSVSDWLAGRNARDAQIYAGAAILILCCAVFAVFGTFGVAAGVLLALNAMTCGLWTSLVLLLAAGVVAGLFVLQRRVDGDDREPIVVDAGPRGRLTLRLSRLTGDSWMMYLDRPAVDFHPVSRIAATLMLLAPRLVRLSGQMWRLSQRLKTMDAINAARGLEILMQAGRSVAIGDLLQEFPQAEPQSFAGDLTIIDGVILLASDPPSLTVTPSLIDEFEDWKKENRRKRRG